jgi:hypothetical protein
MGYVGEGYSQVKSKHINYCRCLAAPLCRSEMLNQLSGPYISIITLRLGTKCKVSLTEYIY